MRVPISWLKDYVDIDITVDEVAKKLLNAGFEVEEIIYTGKEIDKVFSGEIIEITKHMNAEKLSVCKLDIGGEILTIVTGAKNVKTGDIVPVATGGAILPGGKTITVSDLRGVTSYGMLCSGKELNIDDSVIIGAEADGILILPPDTPVGRDIKELLGLNEYILDIAITANRPDCQSILGIARELCAITGKKLKMPKLTYKETEGDINDYLSVKVSEPKLCSRYTARVITDINVQESPKWMRDRLRMAGIRAINNIVDITNYVLTEIGQPMHAFDSAYVKDNNITVRLAKKNESIMALDGKVYQLQPDMLVIADNKDAVGIAGVMGGEYSGVLNTTKTVIYESARFARDSIRHTARALGLRSASSARFEKGVDLYSVELGMQRALALTSELAAGKIIKGVIDINNTETKEKHIVTSSGEINKLLGVDIPETTILKILNGLGINTKTADGLITAYIPLYREDIDNYTDLAEEVIRIYGYSHIEGVMLENAKITSGGKSTRQKKIDKIKNIMCSSGAHEINTYSFLPEKFQDALLITQKENTIKIRNPLSEEYAVMRTNLVYNMLSAVSLNLNRKNNDFALFEIGRSYHPKEVPMIQLPDELERLCFGAAGNEYSFGYLKAVTEKIAEVMGVNLTYTDSGKTYLHPGVSADIIYNNNIIGSFGEAHPGINDKFGFTDKVYIMEILLDGLLSENTPDTRYVPLPKFPSADRDIAIILNDGIPAGSVYECIRDSSPLIHRVELFDIYKGGQIEKGCKSMAYSIRLQADRTLQETEINECINTVLDRLKNKFGARLR